MSVKAYALAYAMRDLEQAFGKDSVILPVLNGMGYPARSLGEPTDEADLP